MRRTLSVRLSVCQCHSFLLPQEDLYLCHHYDQDPASMGFRQNFSGRRRHHVIAPAVLSLSHKHVDGWVTIISVVCSRNGE